MFRWGNYGFLCVLTFGFLQGASGDLSHKKEYRRMAFLIDETEKDLQAITLNLSILLFEKKAPILVSAFTVLNYYKFRYEKTTRLIRNKAYSDALKSRDLFEDWDIFIPQNTESYKTAWILCIPKNMTQSFFDEETIKISYDTEQKEVKTIKLTVSALKCSAYEQLSFKEMDDEEAKKKSFLEHMQTIQEQATGYLPEEMLKNIFFTSDDLRQQLKDLDLKIPKRERRVLQDEIIAYVQNLLPQWNIVIIGHGRKDTIVAGLPLEKEKKKTDKENKKISIQQCLSFFTTVPCRSIALFSCYVGGGNSKYLEELQLPYLLGIGSIGEMESLTNIDALVLYFETVENKSDVDAFNTALRRFMFCEDKKETIIIQNTPRIKIPGVDKAHIFMPFVKKMHLLTEEEKKLQSIMNITDVMINAIKVDHGLKLKGVHPLRELKNGIIVIQKDIKKVIVSSSFIDVPLVIWFDNEGSKKVPFISAQPNNAVHYFSKILTTSGICLTDFLRKTFFDQKRRVSPVTWFIKNSTISDVCDGDDKKTVFNKNGILEFLAILSHKGKKDISDIMFMGEIDSKIEESNNSFEFEQLNYKKNRFVYLYFRYCNLLWKAKIGENKESIETDNYVLKIYPTKYLNQASLSFDHCQSNEEILLYIQKIMMLRNIIEENISINHEPIDMTLLNQCTLDDIKTVVSHKFSQECEPFFLKCEKTKIKGYVLIIQFQNMFILRQYGEIKKQNNSIVLHDWFDRLSFDIQDRLFSQLIVKNQWDEFDFLLKTIMCDVKKDTEKYKKIETYVRKAVDIYVSEQSDIFSDLNKVFIYPKKELLKQCAEQIMEGDAFKQSIDLLIQKAIEALQDKAVFEQCFKQDSEATI